MPGGPLFFDWRNNIKSEPNVQRLGATIILDQKRIGTLEKHMLDMLL